MTCVRQSVAGPCVAFWVVPTLALGLKLENPGPEPSYRRPESATDVRYVEIIERNTHLIYPALAVLVVVLVAWAIISSLRSEDISGIKKAEMKREIIRELRREVYGMTVEMLSKNTGIDRLQLSKVLDEMMLEHIVESRTDTSHVTTWRMRGMLA
jgi:hypothetical protein